ncbi:MAG TPA: IS30 family transposase [Clostridia bacterium]|jgi:IS30 family transposase|nr:IS30 family transposase [Clostridia bacterium]
MDQPKYTPNPRKNKHLSFKERVKIEMLLSESKSAYAIAKVLDRPINTILNELRRGTVEQIKNGRLVKIYFADTGQARYETNRRKTGRRRKLLQCNEFISYVEQKMLEERWSVDAAVGRATIEGKFDKKVVCTKTLYNYIDEGLIKVKNIDLPLKLRRNKKRTRIRENRRKLGDSIESRPSHVAAREEFGHWEIDTVIGSKSKKDACLLVLVERKTRDVLVRKIASRTAEAVEEELKRLKEEYGSYFHKVFKSITSDNGSEFALLSNLKKYGIGVYFTHPYSAFERGTNENHNGLIRRFIPKGERILNYCHEAISRIEDWINSLPRKILGYRTPEELFEEELDFIYAI